MKQTNVCAHVELRLVEEINRNMINKEHMCHVRYIEG